MTERNLDFKVKGMKCHSCEEKISNEVRKLDGVHDVSFSKDRSIVHVSSTEEIDSEKVEKAIESAGEYTVISHDSASINVPPEEANSEQEAPESLYPLFLIVAYITLTTLLIEYSSDSFSIERSMSHFMAGFFLVFSFFKLLDLPGFVSAYMSYDILAKKIPVWGWIYPFVELLLGVMYLLQAIPLVTNTVTLILMLVGAIGVLKALLKKSAIRCACLGTALNLPMTKVTLIEDLLMASMAGAALVM